MGISPSYPCDTTRRSCFGKRFSKTVAAFAAESTQSAQPQSELPQAHSHNSVKHTLMFGDVIFTFG
jgi:hypothetical protein